MTFFMWWAFIIGVIMIGVTPWGFLPIGLAIAFWLGGGP